MSWPNKLLVVMACLAVSGVAYAGPQQKPAPTKKAAAPQAKKPAAKDAKKNSPPPKKAKKEKPPPKETARTQFERGLELYKHEDFDGARAELDKAYAQSKHVAILFYLGLVHEARDDWAQAVTAMEKVIAKPGNLAEERVAKAREIIAVQYKHTGSVVLTSNVDGAEIRIDGVLVGKTPTDKPLRANTGNVLVEVIKEGHVPGADSVAVAPGNKSELDIQLKPTTGKLGYLDIQSQLPGAEVRVDDQYRGDTPLEAPVAVLAGLPHRVELKREAYKTARQNVLVGPGKTRPVKLLPKEDANETHLEGGRLRIRVAQDAPTIEVDGKKRKLDEGKITLAPGLHQVVATAEGYMPLSRSVVVKKHATATLKIDLPPDPETREDLIADAELRESISWGLVIGGAVFMGGGIAMLAWAVPTKDDADAEISTIENTCDFNIDPDFCRAKLDEQNSDKTVAESVLGAGAAAVGLGFIAVATGALLLIASDSPEDFMVEMPEEFGGFEIEPTFVAAPREGFGGVRGRF